MTTHAEKRVLPYTPEQLFDLVAGVERYPEFLPWCTAARIRSRTDRLMIADMAIGFRMIRERFTSRVVLDRPHAIDVTYADGPFKRLTNRWRFLPMPEGCEIDFFVDFEFRSKLLEKMIGLLFEEACRRMISAFEGRARALYGPGIGAVGRQPLPGSSTVA
ncbi:type II toxin-antitoxin system RatA family toxin [Desertibaculum subflavum]|uniref:type II toxin-antitoxin system RatA family toxin n=1 Tax=Desertibaculum subflavum TaxID=2268458 RepID=UPI000E660419